MEVIRARVMGFCMGVRRAVDIAWRESSVPGAVYTLGPLIHNPAVLQSLAGRGVNCLAENEIPTLSQNSTVIIRAHGVSPALEAELLRQGLRVLDATCPHVKQSQKKARFFAERGYTVFLAGEKDHGEISGIRGYIELAAPPAGGLPPCCVVASAEDAESAVAELLALADGAKAELKTALIGQTTISKNEYDAIAGCLRCFFPAIEIQDTICGATAQRQEALRELCGKVDAVVVAGGRGSANTRRLFSLAGELGKPAYLVESPQEIPSDIAVYKTVGLCAGASTPDSLIAEIEEALRGF